MDLKLLPVLLLCATPLLGQEVRMKSVTEKIPTYQIGAPEINPIFFTAVSIKEQKDISILTRSTMS